MAPPFMVAILFSNLILVSFPINNHAAPNRAIPAPFGPLFPKNSVLQDVKSAYDATRARADPLLFTKRIKSRKFTDTIWICIAPYFSYGFEVFKTLPCTRVW